LSAFKSTPRELSIKIHPSVSKNRDVMKSKAQAGNRRGRVPACRGRNEAVSGMERSYSRMSILAFERACLYRHFR